LVEEQDVNQQYYDKTTKSGENLSQSIFDRVFGDGIFGEGKKSKEKDW